MYGCRRPRFAERKVCLPVGLCPVAVLCSLIVLAHSSLPLSLSRTILFRYARAEADAENHQERKGVGAAKNDKSQEGSAVKALEKVFKHAEALLVAATKAGETAKATRKAAQQAKQEAMYLFAKNPSAESVEGRIKNWGDKIKKLQRVSLWITAPLSRARNSEGEQSYSTAVKYD
ncbi:unnamed protein product [Ectocarpus sp. CCAP 1310/34]|nr:unnamed protein product [Ectocarpus sp. CCAP 1310/34]